MSLVQCSTIYKSNPEGAIFKFKDKLGTDFDTVIGKIALILSIACSEK